MSARGVLRALGSVLSWVLLLLVLAVIAVGVVLQRATGAQAYTVLSPSMRPHHPPGSLVLVRPVEVADLGLGDVITYQLHSGRPEVVTHRIISISQSADGAVQFVTQGDHNPDPDAAPVVPGQIRGRLWFGVPLIGYVGTWLSGGQRLVGLGIAVVVLVGYAIAMFAGALRDRRRVVAP